jgi:hypothetical protein
MDFAEDRLPKWRETFLLLFAGMIVAMLVTLGIAFLTLHRQCDIEFFNGTPSIICADDTLLGWMLIVSGSFFLFIFAAYYRMFKLERLQFV